MHTTARRAADQHADALLLLLLVLSLLVCFARAFVQQESTSQVFRPQAIPRTYNNVNGSFLIPNDADGVISIANSSYTVFLGQNGDYLMLYVFDERLGVAEASIAGIAVQPFSTRVWVVYAAQVYCVDVALLTVLNEVTIPKRFVIPLLRISSDSLWIVGSSTIARISLLGNSSAVQITTSPLSYMSFAELDLDNSRFVFGAAFLGQVYSAEFTAGDFSNSLNLTVCPTNNYISDAIAFVRNGELFLGSGARNASVISLRSIPTNCSGVWQPFNISLPQPAEGSFTWVQPADAAEVGYLFPSIGDSSSIAEIFEINTTSLLVTTIKLPEPITQDITAFITGFRKLFQYTCLGRECDAALFALAPDADPTVLQSTVVLLSNYVFVPAIRKDLSRWPLITTSSLHISVDYACNTSVIDVVELDNENLLVRRSITMNLVKRNWSFAELTMDVTGRFLYLVPVVGDLVVLDMTLFSFVLQWSAPAAMSSFDFAELMVFALMANQTLAVYDLQSKSTSPLATVQTTAEDAILRSLNTSDAFVFETDRATQYRVNYVSGDILVVDQVNITSSFVPNVFSPAVAFIDIAHNVGYVLCTFEFSSEACSFAVKLTPLALEYPLEYLDHSHYDAHFEPLGQLHLFSYPYLFTAADYQPLVQWNLNTHNVTDYIQLDPSPTQSGSSVSDIFLLSTNGVSVGLSNGITYSIYFDCEPGQRRHTFLGHCEDCDSDSVSPTGATLVCDPCPDPLEANANRTECVCAALSLEYFSVRNDQRCKPCPNNAICLGQNEIIASPGYWLICRGMMAPPDGNFPCEPELYACPYSSACYGGGCATGYRGLLCGICDRGYGQWNSRCLKCPSRVWTAIAWSGVVLVYAAVFAVLWLFGDRWQYSYGTIKTLISFWQVLSFPLTYPLPPVLNELYMRATDAFSFISARFVTSASLDCLLDTHVSFFIELGGVGLTPVIVILLVTVIYHAPWERLRTCRSSSASNPPPVFDEDDHSDVVAHLQLYRKSGAAIRLCLFLTILTYPAVTGTVAQFFSCKKVGDYQYLNADLTIRCYDNTWFRFLPLAIFLLVVFPLGVPVSFFVLLRYLRNRFDVSFLHKTYKESYYFWDVIELLRKLILLVTAVAFSSSTSTAAALNLNVSIVFLTLHIQLQPYQRAFDHWMQVADLLGVCIWYSWLVSASSSSSSGVFAWIMFAYICVYTIASLVAMIGGTIRKLKSLCATRQQNYEQLED